MRLSACVAFLLLITPIECAYSTACKDSQSWAAALHDKLGGHRDSQVSTHVYVHFGQSVDAGGNCAFDGPMAKLTFSGDDVLQPTEWSNDPHMFAPNEQFKQATIEGLFQSDIEMIHSSKSEMKVAWRWQQTGGFLFQLAVHTESTASDDTNTLKKDIFDGRDGACSAALPLDLVNKANTQYKCVRIATTPDSCARYLGGGAQPIPIQLKIGVVAVGGECEYQEEGFHTLFTHTPYGNAASEHDRSYHPITLDANRALEKSLEQELGDESGYAEEGDGVLDLEEAQDEEGMPPGKEWRYRTGPDGRLELVAGRTPALEALLQGLFTDLNDRVPKDQVFPENIGTSTATHVTFLPKDTTLCTPETESEKEVELFALTEMNGGPKKVNCVKVMPVHVSKADKLSDETPCSLLSKLYSAGTSGDRTKQMAIPADVFVALGKAKESHSGNPCADPDWSPGFPLHLGHDTFSGVSSGEDWRVAEALGPGARGQRGSWAWRVHDGTVQLTFKELSQEAVESFQNTQCHDISKGSWQEGLVLTAERGEGTQVSDCLKITMSADACEHALGLGREATAHVTFEGALAAQQSVQGECEYLGGFRSFGLGFTNEPWASRAPDTPTGLWKRVAIASEWVPMAESWRWRTLDNSVIAIAFETPVDEKDSSRVETVEIQGAQQCEQGVYPDLRAVWEMKTTDPDASYVCFKLTTALTTSGAAYKQATAFELLLDMQEDPNETVDKEGKRTTDFGKWQRKFASLGAESSATVAAWNELGKIKPPVAVVEETGELANMKDTLAHGSLSHFYSHRLPLGHPTVATGKVMHTYGMHTRAVFVRNPKQEREYSGLFSRERVPMILRYSPSNIASSSYLPGWAFKFFRDNVLPADDLLTYHSLQPQTSCDILSFRVSNVPMAPKTNDLREPLKGMCLDEFHKVHGGKIAHTKTDIHHLFLDDSQAWALRNRDKHMEPLAAPLAPHALVFVPDDTTAEKSKEAANIFNSGDPAKCAKNRLRMMEDQLGSIPPQSRLFHVYAMSGDSDVLSFSPEPQSLLGTIVTEETFVRSWYGDSLLHFKHEPVVTEGSEEVTSVPERTGTHSKGKAANEETQEKENNSESGVDQTQVSSEGNQPERPKAPIPQRLEEAVRLRKGSKYNHVLSTSDDDITWGQ